MMASSSARRRRLPATSKTVPDFFDLGAHILEGLFDFVAHLNFLHAKGPVPSGGAVIAATPIRRRRE
jgi:hypothetical protein